MAMHWYVVHAYSGFENKVALVTGGANGIGKACVRRLAAEGTGFGALLREVREERAQALLRRPSLAIEEIAWRLGFHDPDAFSRAFRAWTGLSPSEFRRALHA